MSWFNKLLNNHPIQLRLKQGDKADINTTLTKGRAITGEPHYCTDEKQLYIFDGTENTRANRATYSDYALTQTGNLPTTYAKMDFSGATLVNESEDLFDATNSRILKMPLDTVGMISLSVELDTSTGSNHWIEFQLRAYDDTDTLLFSKRPSAMALVKNNANDAAHQELEFYFGADVEYFEVWWLGSAAIPYTDPAITVVRF